MKRRVICFALILAMCCSFMPNACAITNLDYFISANFGRSYDVFSGPGRHYYRANMGKAMYGGGAARVYGYEGDWIMMGYQLSSGDYRIGYIHKDALSTATYVNGDIQPLNFSHYSAYAGKNCTITDDPVINMKMVASIPENTPVTVLATMGTSWNYVEVNTSQGLMRGFIWSMYLKNSTAPVTSAPTAAPLPTAVPIIPTWPPVTSVPIIPTWPPVTSVPIVTPVPWNPPTVQPRPTAAPGPSTDEWLPAAKNMYVVGNWPVYSGPGEYYFRANGGKATKGEGACQVFGVEDMGYGDWLMIGYSLSNGGYRIGYIRAEAIGANIASVPRLNLAYHTRRLATSAVLTDDPEHSTAAVAQIPAGTYVLFLGYMYTSNAVWAYVEVLSNNQIMRGFMLVGALEAE